MATATQDARSSTGGSALPAAALVVLARVACAPASRAELVRDCGGLIGPAGDAKAQIEAQLATLSSQDLVGERRNTVEATAEGRIAVQQFVGVATAELWASLKDQLLVAKALAIPAGDQRRVKALGRPDRLAIEILVAAYGLKVPKRASPARVRAQLAVVALERAFGNAIGDGLGHGEGLSAKASRLLAAQLLDKPRDPRTDQRLIAALAAQALGTKSADADLLRGAAIRRFVAGKGPKLAVAPSRPVAEAKPSARPTAAAAPPAAPQQAPAAPPPLAVPAAASRPDLKGFAREVKSAARSFAEGWPGNKKAFICRVWDAIARTHPGWGLSEVEFKAMLAEAHRTGHVVLANADLKDKKNIREFQASAISYKNTVWHFIRVED